MKDLKLKEIEEKIKRWGFKIVGRDFTKPWGAYFVIDDKDTEKFVETYFPDQKEKLKGMALLSPKYLILEPGKQFSWQVHERRAEVWRVAEGHLGAYIYDTDNLPDTYQDFKKGDVLFMDQGIRHRLLGLNDWGIVAEIWVHTDFEHLSDEDDIRRIADDFNR